MLQSFQYQRGNLRKGRSIILGRVLTPSQLAEMVSHPHESSLLNNLKTYMICHHHTLILQDTYAKSFFYDAAMLLALLPNIHHMKNIK